MNQADIRIIVVAEHASLRFGGEAALAYFLFSMLRNRGLEAWLVVHGRTEDELRKAFAADGHRILTVPDSWLDRRLGALGSKLTPKMDSMTFGVIRHALTQFRQRGIVKRLIKSERVDVVIEPAPIGPRATSAMYGLGVPVVMGPLCGGMSFPPGFAFMEGRAQRVVGRVLRGLNLVAHRLVPGRLYADVLMVAHDMTRGALPPGCRGRVVELAESGVDLATWTPADPAQKPNDGKIRFVFVGRLVDWKGTRYLVEAFAQVAREHSSATLEIVGDGPLRADLQTMVSESGLGDRITFSGWLSRAEGAKRVRNSDVFVMPSLSECGGTAILEALACGVPVVCTAWGGPNFYVDDTCGIRVRPHGGPQPFVAGLAEAMGRLASDESLRKRMGEAAIRRARSNGYDWDSKADRIIDELRVAVARNGKPATFT